jgi:hypothetical protein
MSAAENFLDSTVPVYPFRPQQNLNSSVTVQAALKRFPRTRAPEVQAGEVLLTKTFLPVASKSSVPRQLLEKLVQEIAAAIAQGRVSEKQILAAAKEAIRVIAWNIFSETAYPKIRIDDFGEICFIVVKNSGYADLGISGIGEISFGIRNDLDPDYSFFGDEPIADDDLPGRLRLALSKL